MGKVIGEFQILSTNTNPRSQSGTATCLGGTSQELLHWKSVNDPQLLAREANELMRARAATAQVDRILPVQVYAFVPEVELLVTQHVGNADTLFNYLWNRSRWWDWTGLPRKEATDIGSRLGRWLRAYHDSSPSSQPALPHIQAICGRVVRKLITLGNGSVNYFSPVVCEKFRQAFVRGEKEPECVGHESVVQVHGDLDLVNILVTRNKMLYLLDFADTRLGVAWEDIARLYHSLWGISSLSARREHILKPCMEALLASYQMPQRDLDSPVFRLVRGYCAMCVILTDYLFGSKLGYSGSRISRKLATLNAAWIGSVDW